MENARSIFKTNAVSIFKRRLQPGPIHECWLWPGFINKDGYGRIVSRGKAFLAHRVAFEIYWGKLPSLVVHLCPNRACCNPRHLDMGYGTRHLHAKLTEEDIWQIRESDASLDNLALVFGVTPAYIWKIQNRQAWKHLP